MTSPLGQTRPTTPVLRSLAFEDIPAPDYADVFLIPLPSANGSTTGSSSSHAPNPQLLDPGLWAKTIFSQRSMPGWFAAILRMRQFLRKQSPSKQALNKTADASPKAVQIRKAEGEEALIAFDGVPLSIRCCVGVSAAQELVRVTTVVRFNTAQGRRIFKLLRFTHPVLMNSMMRKAARLLLA